MRSSDIFENAIKSMVEQGISVLLADAIGADYCHDEYAGNSFAPDAVVEAGSTEEVSAVLKICSENSIPVTVRGAGTGQVGGSVAIKGGIVLSVKPLNKILSYNEEEKTLFVQAGVLLQDVKAEAEKHGMYYPPDPGEQTATIGGNVATNAGGPCAVKYGATCDYVADATIVLADGSIERLGSAEKYRSVIGSEGTLGIVTELSLKLIEKAKADAILLFPFADTESCFKAASVLQNNCEPAVIEFMDTDIVEFSGEVTGNPVFPIEMDGERVGATLMLTIEAENDDIVMEKMEAIAELADELECMDILVGDTPTMKREFWAAHAAFHTSLESGAKSAYEANIDVPSRSMNEMLEYAKTLGEEKNLKVLCHAHIGSGGMHIHAVSDLRREESAPIAQEFLADVYAKCAELGGSIRGEYGIGYAKTAYLGEAEREKFVALKQSFDPKGILNPGKVVQQC